MGCILLGRFKGIDRAVVGQHLLGWTVKGFFIPLMFVYLVVELDKCDSQARTVQLDLVGWFYLCFGVAFVIDLLFTCAGYVFSLRLTDSHIRSCDPTASGWVIALMCYEPFWYFFYQNFWPYRDGQDWSTWFADSALLYIWTGLILSCMVVYAWTTLTFGIRFSNLTHRGILTTGPYRFSKHPGYLAKNAVWWLMAVPFLSAEGGEAALRHSLMLAVVNVIYYLRARTEERHLSSDPDYVRYALWMNDHGVFRFFGKRISALRYRAPADWDSTLQVEGDASGQ
jgi:protein-S-isoprenylcysteine O-methyltransferase Ste14